ncbi:MAG: hypothetical protein RLY16_3071 [Bacteroidota bacterium]|jgi:phosphoribosylamine--glycine ligase
MNILIIGSGGREHALAWKIKQSTKCDRLFIAPGNAGTAQLGTNVPIESTNFEALGEFCIAQKIGMMVVGPEEPLVKGIYDYFKSQQSLQHIHVFGPSKDAAQLEGSKAFAKGFMQRNQIPTAAYGEFDENNYLQGVEYIRNHALPIVLKADGLAAGKGVLICHSHIEALAEFELMIQQAKFGEAGKKVVVEEFLDGIEMSVFVLTDGEQYLVLPEAKDYKRVGKGDTGLNTGGMGAVSPVPFADDAFMHKVLTKVIKPTIHGLQVASLDYHGVIFIGLIKVNNEPYVIEYNCRFGDPETEVVLPRIENDLVSMFEAVSRQRLHEIILQINPLAAVTVVAVSGGYPGAYEKHIPIQGLQETELDGTIIYHAGTTSNEQNEVVTNGGRVLAVTSFGDDIKGAVQQSNYVLSQIYFENMYFRTDIGYEFM